jgi:hypothetical protein
MTMSLLRRFLYALGAAVVGVAAGALTAAPTGCSSDCGSNCPINTALIETDRNVDPGITALAYEGPACPTGLPGCRGDDHTTLCNHVYVTGAAEGYCDLYIAISGREPMAIRLQFGPRSTVGCCKGYPVVGDWHFTIPTMDAGIYGDDGGDAVRVLRPDAGGGDDGAVDAGDDGAADAGAPDDAAAD